MKDFKISVIILVILAVSGTAFGVFHSLYHEPPPAYRPMVFYDKMLFWDERLIETQPDDMEYIGTVNSSVPAGEKPTKDFECNSKYFMGAKFYCDKYGNYYLCRTNGDLLLLETSGVGHALITPSKIRSN